MHTYIHTYIHMDMVIWDSTSKQCQIIEVTVSLDTNLPKAYKDKKQKYIPLVSQMLQMYREYKTSVTIIAVGALGAIPKNPDLRHSAT